MPASRPAELAGMAISRDAVVLRLEQVGCAVERRGCPSRSARRPGALTSSVRPISSRRSCGSRATRSIPSVLPSAPPGSGLTEEQKLHRSIGRALAAAGHAEVLSYPFVAPEVHDAFGLAADDPRRRAARIANPLSEAEPELRTSLLPGLLTNLHRNVGRGMRDLALFEMGLVYLPRPGATPPPEPGIEQRPADDVIAAMKAGIPDQPLHVAVALCGDIERAGWWGPGRAATWADAVEAARVVAGAARAELEIRADSLAPWHPGRCAALLLDGAVVGHAGELHPRVVATLGLPERTCAMELDLSSFAPPGPAPTPTISTFPPVLLDVALVVASDVPAADVLAALRDGAGDLLESVRLFDVYADDVRLGAGLKSLAFSLRFRSMDRTLTVEEATVSRDAAVARAADESVPRCGRNAGVVAWTRLALADRPPCLTVADSAGRRLRPAACPARVSAVRHGGGSGARTPDGGLGLVWVRVCGVVDGEFAGVGCGSGVRWGWSR